MIEGDGGLNLHPPAIQAPNGTEVDHIPKERKDVSYKYRCKWVGLRKRKISMNVNAKRYLEGRFFYRVCFKTILESKVLENLPFTFIRC